MLPRIPSARGTSVHRPMCTLTVHSGCFGLRSIKPGALFHNKLLFDANVCRRGVSVSSFLNETQTHLRRLHKTIFDNIKGKCKPAVMLHRWKSKLWRLSRGSGWLRGPLEFCAISSQCVFCAFIWFSFGAVVCIIILASVAVVTAAGERCVLTAITNTPKP